MKTQIALSSPLDQPERLKCSECGCDHFKINLEGERDKNKSINSVECENCHEIFTLEILN